MLAKIKNNKSIVERCIQIKDTSGLVRAKNDFIKMKDTVMSGNVTFSNRETFIKILNIEIYTSLCILSMLDENESLNYLLESLNYNNNDATIYNNIAYKYLTAYNNYTKAIEYYTKGIAINPKLNLLYHGLIQIYKQKKDTVNELKYIDAGLKECPEDSEFHNFKGVYHFERNDIPESLKVLNEGLKRTKVPNVMTKLQMNIGHMYSSMAQMHKSLEYYVKSIETEKTHDLAYHNILLNLLYFNDTEVPKSVTNAYGTAIKNAGYTGTEIDKYHKHLSILLESNLCILRGTKSLQQLVPEKFAKSRNKNVSNSSKSAEKISNSVEKLRIGFFSADLIDHAVSIFTDAIFRYYDTSKFEYYLYSNKYYTSDLIQSISPGNFICYEHVQNYDTVKIVQTILGHKLDCLIDLSGYTSGNRLDIFMTLRNSGIKMYTFIGYPCDTGIKGLCRITDSFTEMESRSEQLSGSELLYMPGLFLCFTPKLMKIEIAKKYLAGYESKIIIGSFSKLQKINQDVIKVWNQILDQVPNAVLLLKSKYFTGDLRSQWTQYFNGRVILLNGTETYIEHMTLFNLLDLSLDTWPYSGTTITCESLFMNIPVVTYCKGQHVTRVSGSILNAMNMNEFITDSMESYVQTAVKYCNSIINNNGTIMASTRGQNMIHRRFLEIMEPKKYAKKFEDTLSKALMFNSV